MKTTTLGSIGLFAALTLAGCGDDGGGGGETGDASTGSATEPTASSTMSTSSSTMSTSSSTMSTSSSSTSETDSSGSGEPTSSTGTDTDTGTDTETDPSTGTGSTESDSSSSTGMAVDDCDACTEDQVCIEYQAFMTTYSCVPRPKECEADVDCECGGQLCDEGDVCNDMGPANMLTCICIAC